MATIVNTPAATHEHVGEESGSNTMLNTLIGIIAVLAVAFLVFYFGLPLIRTVGTGAPAPQQINNNAPPQGNSAPQLNVPDKVNIDVNTPNGGGGNAPAPQK